MIFETNDATVKYQFFGGGRDHLKWHKIWEMCCKHLARPHKICAKSQQKKNVGTLNRGFNVIASWQEILFVTLSTLFVAYIYAI